MAHGGVGMMGLIVLVPFAMLFLSGQWRMLGGMLLLMMLGGFLMFGAVAKNDAVAPAAAVAAPMPEVEVQQAVPQNR